MKKFIGIVKSLPGTQHEYEIEIDWKSSVIRKLKIHTLELEIGHIKTRKTAGRQEFEVQPKGHTHNENYSGFFILLGIWATACAINNSHITLT